MKLFLTTLFSLFIVFSAYSQTSESRVPVTPFRLENSAFLRTRLVGVDSLYIKRAYGNNDIDIVKERWYHTKDGHTDYCYGSWGYKEYSYYADGKMKSYVNDKDDFFENYYYSPDGKIAKIVNGSVTTNFDYSVDGVTITTSFNYSEIKRLPMTIIKNTAYGYKEKYYEYDSKLGNYVKNPFIAESHYNEIGKLYLRKLYTENKNDTIYVHFKYENNSFTHSVFDGELPQTRIVRKFNNKGYITNLSAYSYYNSVWRSYLEEEYMYYKADGSPVNLDEQEVKAVQVYTTESMIHIKTAGKSSIYVYGVSGVLLKALKTMSNLTEIRMPKGPYIVLVNNYITKVLVK